MGQRPADWRVQRIMHPYRVAIPMPAVSLEQRELEETRARFASHRRRARLIGLGGLAVPIACGLGFLYWWFFGTALGFHCM